MNQTKTIEERLANLEKDQEQLISRQYELIENVNGGLISVKWFLNRMREELFQAPLPEESNEKYDIDLSLEEIQDTIDYIQALLDEDPFTTQEEDNK
ncbi:MAG: hypothetical protein ACFFAU_19160 [Candidatus Hodarchaeota archaeon]